jgi:hypothetical protein
MTERPTPPRPRTTESPLDPGRRRSLALGLGLAAGAAGLGSGCGGGSGSGGTGDTVGAFSSGSISGFGSVIVNGVRYDESRARIEDDSGATRSASELRLGMTTEIDSDTVRTDAAGLLVATARTVRFASELLGPVSRVDLAAGTLTVLGQTVRLSVATVIDPRLTAGLASVGTGSVVEVYGYYDGSAYVATRLEPVTTAPSAYRLRGPVVSLDTTARTLRIGGQTLGGLVFSYGNASNVPGDLANGQFVRLLIATTLGNNSATVSAFRSGQTRVADATDAKLEGRITQFSTATSFSVNGQAVDASAAPVSGLALGVRVEVEGTIRSGILRATQVKIESEDQIKADGVDLRGPVESIDRSLRRFVVRGTVVSYAVAGIRYDNGSEADLAVGRQVEARGTLSNDRTLVEASRIRFV